MMYEYQYWKYYTTISKIFNRYVHGIDIDLA
jgi:hypothetical protein